MLPCTETVLCVTPISHHKPDFILVLFVSFKIPLLDVQDAILVSDSHPKK